MKNTLLILITCLIFILSGTKAQQTYPIYVTPSLTPPYSLTLSDYSQPGSQRLVVTIMVKDVTVTNLPVRLHLKMETMTGVTIESIPTASVMPIFLSGGETSVLFGDDMKEYFNINNLQFKGYSKEEYRRSGQLPEGFYRFTVEVRHFTTGKLISNQGSAMAWMALGKPPVLKTPDNKVEMGQIAGMPLTFSWIPSNVGVPGVIPQYTFEMWEMRVPGIDPNVIAASMPVFYSTTQMNTSLVVLPAELMLEPGMSYAWRVTASDVMGQVSFAQGGRSEVRSFIYQCHCDEITNLTVERKGQDVTYRWFAADNHSSFNVEMENPESGWSKSERVFDTKYEFHSDPDKTYRLRVQAICRGNEQNPSDFSSWQTITIPAPEKQEDICLDCECGKEFPNKPLTNFTLRTDLHPGDTIITSDGSSRFILKSVTSQGNGVYKGQFLFWVRIWGVKFLCDYWDLKVNTDNQIVDMGFESVSDPKFLVDVDATKEYINQVKDAVDVVWDEINHLIDDLYEKIQLDGDINRYVEDFVAGVTNGIESIDFSQLPEYKDRSTEEIEQAKQKYIEAINSEKFKEDLSEYIKERKEKGLNKDELAKNIKQNFVAAEQDAWMTVDDAFKLEINKRLIEIGKKLGEKEYIVLYSAACSSSSSKNDNNDGDIVAPKDLPVSIKLNNQTYKGLASRFDIDGRIVVTLRIDTDETYIGLGGTKIKDDKTVSVDIQDDGIFLGVITHSNIYSCVPPANLTCKLAQENPDIFYSEMFSGVLNCLEHENYTDGKLGDKLLIRMLAKYPQINVSTLKEIASNCDKVADILFDGQATGNEWEKYGEYFNASFDAFQKAGGKEEDYLKRLQAFINIFEEKLSELRLTNEDRIALFVGTFTDNELLYLPMNLRISTLNTLTNVRAIPELLLNKKALLSNMNWAMRENMILKLLEQTEPHERKDLLEKLKSSQVLKAINDNLDDFITLVDDHYSDFLDIIDRYSYEINGINENTKDEWVEKLYLNDKYFNISQTNEQNKSFIYSSEITNKGEIRLKIKEFNGNYKEIPFYDPNTSFQGVIKSPLYEQREVNFSYETPIVIYHNKYLSGLPEDKKGQMEIVSTLRAHYYMQKHKDEETKKAIWTTIDVATFFIPGGKAATGSMRWLSLAINIANKTSSVTGIAANISEENLINKYGQNGKMVVDALNIISAASGLVDLGITKTSKYFSTTTEELVDIGAFYRKNKALVDNDPNFKPVKDLYESLDSELLKLVDKAEAAGKGSEGLLASIVSKLEKENKALVKQFTDDFGNNAEMLAKFADDDGLVEAWKILRAQAPDLAKNEDWLASISIWAKTEGNFISDLQNAEVFAAYRAVRENPEEAWNIIKGLREQGMISDSFETYAKSKFFRDIMQKGMAFEQTIEQLIKSGDATLIAKIEKEFGLAPGKLSEYEHITQLQINLDNGRYFIADNAWVKRIESPQGVVYECLIGESKLGTSTDLSDMQKLFKTQWNGGKKIFITRSVKEEIVKVLPQNSNINIKGAIRTNGPAINITTSIFK